MRFVEGQVEIVAYGPEQSKSIIAPIAVSIGAAFGFRNGVQFPPVSQRQSGLSRSPMAATRPTTIRKYQSAVRHWRSMRVRRPASTSTEGGDGAS